MSVCIPKLSLTDQDKFRIQANLFFQPDPGFFVKKCGAKPPEPIVFYTTDETNVYLPFASAQTLTGRSNRDRRYPSVDVEFTGQLRPEQQPVVEEAIAKLDQHGSVLLHLPTGFGKTVIASYLACLSGLITLVLLTRKVLIDSWRSTFQQLTNAKVWVVGEPIPDQFQVIISMDRRLTKIPASIKDQVGLLIADECHAFYTQERVKSLLYCQPRHIIACSATPYTWSRKILEALIGPHSVERQLDVQFRVSVIQTGIVPDYSLTKQGFPKWSDVNQSLADNPTRNQMIVETVKVNPDRKILILCWLKDHALHLAELISQHGIKVAVMVGAMKTYSDSQVLIGTVGKIGTGFDEKMACPDFQGQRIDMLILAASTKSANLLTQMAGRVFRAAMPDIVDIVDELPSLERHFKRRLKWYIKHQAQIDYY